MKTVRILLMLLVFTVGASVGEAFVARPFTLQVLDEAGRGVGGVRIVTDNGIVCFTRLDGAVSWSEASVMHRSVRLEIQGGTPAFGPQAATRRFTRGGHATVTVHRLPPASWR